MLGQIARRLAYKIRHQLQPKTITLNGIRLTTERDHVPKDIQKQLYQNRYESQELSLVRAALVPGDRVLEVGAGIGFIGIACAKICGQDNILSYEPNPAMKAVIEKNYQLNGLRPNLRNKVLDVEAGEVEFYFSEGVLSSSLIDRNQGSATRVEADGISQVMDDFAPTAIVMDVEGAEIELLRRCSLDGVSKLVIEMHPHVVGPEQIDDLCDYLKDTGFSLKNRISKVYMFQRNDV
ncbi:MAG: FkbM family methyltransferase [Roseibium sp.]|uniref:FkbM family methyltransferase n=1 Tax=Roseibium sp. TaxID=1936156 RepID=UPI001B071AF3|nr:FkbM family methyltransferase [Roseibium sp.]MBO6891889.1 FkbM family methyltransferase [Roseibium sp.]MBO6929244.1 FkbM family methyltransferase [Roseibium sp.]